MANKVPQMVNDVVVEGILNEFNLKESVHQGDNVIMGEIILLVEQEVYKDEGVLALNVPVRFWTREFTRKGNPNSTYIALQDMMAEGRTIASVGYDAADCIRVTGSSLAMQEYYAPGGSRLISFPAVRGSFINPVRRGDMSPKAIFDCEVVIAKMRDVLDREGTPVEPRTLEILGVHVGFNEMTDIIPFRTSDPRIINGIESIYAENDPITFFGRLNFSSKNEVYMEEVEIGDPIERERTVRVSELVIRGVSPRDLSSAEYEMEDIKRCVSERAERLEQRRQEAISKATKAEAPRTNDARKESVDLGLGF